MSEELEHKNAYLGDIRIGDRIFSTSRGRNVYTCRLAENEEEVRQAQRLRFQIFNIELKEGLPESFKTGLDVDEFDPICDHLLVIHQESQAIVGTYRLQTGLHAQKNLGYYSAQEFDFRPLEPYRAEIVELGRACIHAEHRNLLTLGCLWRGIKKYADRYDARYLVGCSSLTSQDEAEGAGAYYILQKHLVPAEFHVDPLPHCACSLEKLPEKTVKIPKLLGAYMSIGAKICGAPAIDRTFKTIDFLTWLDLNRVPASILEAQ